MKDMTKGSPAGLILRFAFPILLGNLFQQFYSIADAAIVGRFLGAEALAAVGATGSVQVLILGFCIGTCNGFCIPVSQQFGGKNYGRMRSLLYNSILLTGIIALIVTSACILSRRGILYLLSVPQNIWAQTHIYILISFIGIPFTLLYNLTAGILRSVGDSKSPFLILSVSTAANILLDLLCVVVLNWGCGGAAAATVASQAFSALLCTGVIWRKYDILHLRPEDRTADCDQMNLLLMTGIPMGLQTSFTAIGVIVLQSATNALGSIYTSAHTAAVRINMFAMSPLDSLSTGVATFCSQNYGAGDSRRIRDGFRISTAIAVFYGITVGTLLVFFGRNICRIFLSAGETEILDAAALVLRRCGYFYPILGILDISRITVQALGHSGRAMVAGVMEMFARAGVVILFSPEYGFNAISFADPAAWIAADLYIIPVCQRMLYKLTHGSHSDFSSP